MKIEFEVVFAPVDREVLREKIRGIWWICTKKNTLMKRVVFENPEDPKHSFLRLRDEWWKITCCLKVENSGQKHIESVREFETEVQDLEVMRQIFLQLWIREKAYQETCREIWEIPGEIEFMIDEWPGMKPFIEIEWKDEQSVKKYAWLLWFDYDRAIFWTVGEVYKSQLWVDISYVNTLPEITFDNPVKK